jgi:hypothetical protein
MKIMKSIIFFLAVISFLTLASCDVRSERAKRALEKFEPAPVPVVSPTPELEPIDPADVLEVDIAQQGELISLNDPKAKKTVVCSKYNQVMLNDSDGVITIKGACRQIMINGDRNDVTAEAVMSIVFNGEENKVKYSKYANGTRPVVTNNKKGNTAEKIAAAAKK